MAQPHFTQRLTFWLLVGLAAVAGVGYLSFGAGSSWRDKDSAGQSDPVTPCAGNWTMCRDNADLVNYSSKAGDARRACIAAVDEASKYGPPKWCSGWLCEDFPSYRMGKNAPDDGLLTLIDDHLQIQNRLGARVRSTVYCTYNIRTEKVVALDIGTY